VSHNESDDGGKTIYSGFVTLGIISQWGLNFFLARVLNPCPGFLNLKNSGEDILKSYNDLKDKRSGFDRRIFSYSVHIPERRTDKDRRFNLSQNNLHKSYQTGSIEIRAAYN